MTWSRKWRTSCCSVVRSLLVAGNWTVSFYQQQNSQEQWRITLLWSPVCCCFGPSQVGPLHHFTPHWHEMKIIVFSNFNFCCYRVACCFFIYRKCFHISLQISLSVFVSCEDKGKKTTTFFMKLCSNVQVAVQ